MTPEHGEPEREYSIEQLSDYLDAGENPPNPAIDDDPEYQRVLRGLRRLRDIAGPLIDEDARTIAPADDDWMRGVLTSIAREARAGRDVPLDRSDHGSPVRHVITEGTLRGIVRDAADQLPGLIIERCTFDGDVTEPGAVLSLEVTASLAWRTAERFDGDALRAAIVSALEDRAGIILDRVDIAVVDVHVPSSSEEKP